jgi:hypothetical protein
MNAYLVEHNIILMFVIYLSIVLLSAACASRVNESASFRTTTGFTNQHDFER